MRKQPKDLDDEELVARLFFEVNEAAKASPAVFGECLLKINPYRTAQEVAEVLVERLKSLKGNAPAVVVESISVSEIKS